MMIGKDIAVENPAGELTTEDGQRVPAGKLRLFGTAQVASAAFAATDAVGVATDVASENSRTTSVAAVMVRRKAPSVGSLFYLLCKWSMKQGETTKGAESGGKRCGRRSCSQRKLKTLKYLLKSGRIGFFADL